MSLWGDEKRVPIKTSVKKKIYARVKGKCEACGRQLDIKHGDFHHTRDPKVSAMAKTVQFLCPTCHRARAFCQISFEAKFNPWKLFWYRNFYKNMKWAVQLSDSFIEFFDWERNVEIAQTYQKEDVYKKLKEIEARIKGQEPLAKQ